jgi:hypothetical protein
MKWLFFLGGVLTASWAAVHGVFLNPSFDATEAMTFSVCWILAGIFLSLQEA